MLALIPQSGDSSGATLGVRSVALLQVTKWSRSLQRTCSSPQKAHRCLSDVVYGAPETDKKFAYFKKIYYLCSKF